MRTFTTLSIISGWLILILWISSLAKKNFPKQQELRRKIVHIGTGPIILIAWWLQLSQLICISIGSLITLVLAINYRLRFFSAIEDTERKSFGTIAYGLSITILFVLFWPDNYAASCFGILAMSFGDGLAGLIGRQVISPKWIILGQTKSLVGTLTMGIVIALLSILIASIGSIDIEIKEIIILSLLGIVFEQFSPWGIDNLTVPIGLGYTWVWLTT